MLLSLRDNIDFRALLDTSEVVVVDVLHIGTLTDRIREIEAFEAVVPTRDKVSLHINFEMLPMPARFPPCLSYFSWVVRLIEN